MHVEARPASVDGGLCLDASGKWAWRELHREIGARCRQFATVAVRNHAACAVCTEKMRFTDWQAWHDSI